MNAGGPVARGASIGAEEIFPTLSRAMFAASYPAGAHKLPHSFGAHPLLEGDALASLAEALPATSVECIRGGRPTGFGGETLGERLAIAEVVRSGLGTDSYAVLRDVEQVPAYAGLIAGVLTDLEPDIIARTGKLLARQGRLHVLGPRTDSPDYVDPGHTLLLQLAGEMAITVFPAEHSLFEACRTGGGRNVPWRDELAEHGVTFRLEAGEAIYVPAMAPRQFRSGAAPSTSLSISWLSDWSTAEADAHAFNGLLRRWGFDPRPPGRWPSRNRSKSIAWRALRRLPGID